jgi:hypothetical protein
MQTAPAKGRRPATESLDAPEKSGQPVHQRRRQTLKGLAGPAIPTSRLASRERRDGRRHGHSREGARGRARRQVEKGVERGAARLGPGAAPERDPGVVQGVELGGEATNLAERGPEEGRWLTERGLAYPSVKATLRAGGGAFAKLPPALPASSAGGSERGIGLLPGTFYEGGYDGRTEVMPKGLQRTLPLRGRVARVRGGTSDGFYKLGDRDRPGPGAPRRGQAVGVDEQLAEEAVALDLKAIR